jgi:hypothetical protein
VGKSYMVSIFVINGSWWGLFLWRIIHMRGISLFLWLGKLFWREIWGFIVVSYYGKKRYWLPFMWERIFALWRRG